MREEAFELALRADPDDNTSRLIFADWLEEQDDPRGELLRLGHTLTQAADFPGRADCEVRLRDLLAAGVEPVGPRWTNSLGMQFVWVPRGRFLMGSPPVEPGRQDDEVQHLVSLTRGFYLGVNPITQTQWRAVMGDNPSCTPGDDRPVECVSWEDCEEFCRALTRKEGLPAEESSPYRLPTEAEWEYACRAGTTTAYFFGQALSLNQANYHVNHAGRGRPAGHSPKETTPVGSFPANGWGLRDMHGNVFEWCADWYAPYPREAVVDPFVEKKEGGVRVLRGGSWHSLVGRCRSAFRAWGAPSYRGGDVGCRVCFQMGLDYQI
jgi:sulfatase modifying factor 1